MTGRPRRVPGAFGPGFGRAAHTSRVVALLRPVVVVWDGVAALIARVLEPIDGEARDRIAEGVLADSLTGRVVAGLVGASERACAGSIVIDGLQGIRNQFGARSRVDRVRTLAAISAVAALTVLLLRALQLPPAPYTWVVPSMVLGLSLSVLAAVRGASRLS